MEKRRETQIMLDALAHAGFEVTDRMMFAVNYGLKQIRRERFEERKGRSTSETREWLSS